MRSVLFAAGLLAAPLLTTTVSGCAKPDKMHASAAVPASEGTVRATEGTDGNTDVTLWVKHLADPARVQGDSTTYVVWFQAVGAKPQNVGAMAVDANLEGRFDGSTPHKRFWVTVTPEPAATADQPTHDAVFSSEVDRSE